MNKPIPPMPRHGMELHTRVHIRARAADGMSGVDHNVGIPLNEDPETNPRTKQLLAELRGRYPNVTYVTSLAG